VLTTVQPIPAAAAGTWLDRFNAWRAASNLPALTENTTWSQGDYDHSLYMVKNDQVTHYELSTLPYYTVDGDTAARNGNIEVNSSTSFTDDQSIDWWMAAPFHELGMMDPRLTQTGFGSYREVKSGWQAGFTLDVLRGNSFTGGTYPVYFPGNGSNVPLTSYNGNEFPDPLQACTGYTAPTGLPITIQVGGNVATTVTAHAFSGNGSPLAHCVIDSNSPSVGSDLTSRGAVILIPQAPLQAGVNYSVALTVNGVPYTWSFGVNNTNTITANVCTTSVSVATTQSATSFGVGLSAGTCLVSYFEVQQFDVTLNEGWFGLPAIGSGNTSTANLGVEGFQGHTYNFEARAHLAGGLVTQWAQATTVVSPTATKAQPWSGLYTLDAYGVIHLADSPPLGGGPSFSSPLARAVKAAPGASAPQNGLILDGYGGLHSYGGPTLQVGQEPYYPGNDIARDFVFLPSGAGGYELDGYGGIHPFSLGNNPMPSAASQYPYFPGHDLAKKITLLADGSGGWVLDAYGGMHPWSVSGYALPTSMAEYGYWGGFNIARDIWLAPGSSATSANGYVLDGFGGFHPFWSAAAAAPPAMAMYGYWGGQDIARAMWFMPSAGASAATGYTLDMSGGIHPFTAPGQALPATPGQYAYWPGQDVAKALFGA
jgi:cysteine-rich secretory family protein